MDSSFGATRRILVKQSQKSSMMCSIAIVIGNVWTEYLSCTIAQMAWCSLESTAGLQRVVITLGAPITAKERSWPMVLSPQKIATGCTVFSDTRQVAPVIGRVGMEQPLNNCASADCYTTRTPTAVTGLRMWKDARSTVSWWDETP